MYTQFINELNVAHSINLAEAQAQSNVFVDVMGGVKLTIDFNVAIPEITVEVADAVTYSTQMRGMDSDIKSVKIIRTELTRWIKTKQNKEN